VDSDGSQGSDGSAFCIVGCGYFRDSLRTKIWTDLHWSVWFVTQKDALVIIRSDIDWNVYIFFYTFWIFFSACNEYHRLRRATKPQIGKPKHRSNHSTRHFPTDRAQHYPVHVCAAIRYVLPIYSKYRRLDIHR